MVPIFIHGYPQDALNTFDLHCVSHLHLDTVQPYFLIDISPIQAFNCIKITHTAVMKISIGTSQLIVTIIFFNII